MKEFKRSAQFFEAFEPVKYKMPVGLSDDEMIRHVWDIENVRNLMNLRSYYHANDMRAEEMADLWVAKEENKQCASYGTNWGYYFGYDEVKKWYVDEHAAKRAQQLEWACKNNPELENKPENLGYGCMQMLPYSTSLIRIADDGKTAKGFWYVIGQQTNYEEAGTARSMWMNGRVACDFVKEGSDDDVCGGWKICHYFDCNDQTYRAGEAYSFPTYPEPGEDPMEIEFGEPTIKMITHNGAFNYADDYPPMPEPYATMTPELSYGPAGHPKFQGGKK